MQAAVTEPWSNGPVEGHVNRLKTIKRQMYGRAGFDLLRQRVFTWALITIEVLRVVTRRMSAVAARRAMESGRRCRRQPASLAGSGSGRAHSEPPPHPSTLHQKCGRP